MFSKIIRSLLFSVFDNVSIPYPARDFIADDDSADKTATAHVTKTESTVMIKTEGSSMHHSTQQATMAHLKQQSGHANLIQQTNPQQVICRSNKTSDNNTYRIDFQMKLMQQQQQQSNMNGPIQPPEKKLRVAGNYAPSDSMNYDYQVRIPKHFNKETSLLIKLCLEKYKSIATSLSTTTLLIAFSLSPSLRFCLVL